MVSTAFLGLALPAWAGPRGGGGGGGHFGGGGRGGGFAVAALALRQRSTAVAFEEHRPSEGILTGRSVGRPSVAPRFYYGGTRMSAVRPQGFARSVGPSTRPYVGRSAAATRQPNRVNSIAARSRADRSADFDRNKSSAKSRRLSCGPKPGFESADVDRS